MKKILTSLFAIFICSGLYAQQFDQRVWFLEELTKSNAAAEPENRREREQLENIFAALGRGANAQSLNRINIQAQFNSAARTYLHRDELKMTVTADQNCYFKIIHIDVNNQMKMIYPNNIERDNYLRANTPVSVFDTSSYKYFLYGPYGEETILLIASPVQFTNIEKEFIAPWTAVTAESLRETVADSRSSDIPITFTGEGQVRYTINILKPHEEYEYDKPENMTEMYRSMRDDALRQGGSFEGNETSGYCLVNDARVSYRALRETVQFAAYYLDSYVSNSGVTTRGSSHNFSFDKPGNISQAIQEVKNGIESNGGVFSGNEQQGDFKVSVITGRYQITNLVNVIITEKPFVIPSSLIESKVKNYFNR